jgi:hypothetical protein
LRARTWGRQRCGVDVERVGFELDREPVVSLSDGAVRPGRRVDREASTRRHGVIARGEPRDAKLADNQKVGRLAPFELRLVDERERAADEFHRHEPSASDAGGRRWERHEPAADGCQRLVREDDRLVPVGDC